MVIKGFNKCGVSVTVDGSEDDNLEDYEIESDDPFVTSEHDNDCDHFSDESSSSDAMMIIYI